MQITNTLSQGSRKTIIANIEEEFQIDIKELVAISDDYQDHCNNHDDSSHNRSDGLELYRITTEKAELFDIFCTECRDIMIRLRLHTPRSITSI